MTVVSNTTNEVSDWLGYVAQKRAEQAQRDAEEKRERDERDRAEFERKVASRVEALAKLLGKLCIVPTAPIGWAGTGRYACVAVKWGKFWFVDSTRDSQYVHIFLTSDGEMPSDKNVFVSFSLYQEDMASLGDWIGMAAEQLEARTVEHREKVEKARIRAEKRAQREAIRAKNNELYWQADALKKQLKLRSWPRFSGNDFMMLARDFMALAKRHKRELATNGPSPRAVTIAGEIRDFMESLSHDAALAQQIAALEAQIVPFDNSDDE